MQAYQIRNGSDIKPLPFQSAYRKGDAPAEIFRKQATGELERVVPDLKQGRFVRTIALRNGAFTGLASDGGSLLTFVISGELTLTLDAVAAQADVLHGRGRSRVEGLRLAGKLSEEDRRSR